MPFFYYFFEKFLFKFLIYFFIKILWFFKICFLKFFDVKIFIKFIFLLCTMFVENVLENIFILNIYCCVLFFILNKMKNIKLLFWLETAFYLFFWFYLLFQPELALKTIIIICAIYALVSWIVWLIFAIKAFDYWDRGLLWVISWFSIVFGALLLCFPQIWEMILKIFVSLLWIAIVVKWSFMIRDSFYLKKQNIGNRFWLMIMWCFLVLLWILMEMNWIMTVLLFNRLIGLCLIGWGIAMLVWSFQISRFVKDVKKWLENWEVVEIEMK